MPSEKDHIAVCICTFKRPELLKRLLDALLPQETQGAFTFSVVVADNDSRQSAKQTVTEFAADAPLRIVYCAEPVQNIALARNRAIEHAEGNFIAFIDDDEIPDRQWLSSLYQTCSRFSADGVLGPVKPYFEHEPPEWLIKAKFCERPSYPTGYRLKENETRTGNVLFRRAILQGNDAPFRAEFRIGGEDVDFFSRMMKNGEVFVWCEEAPVHELVPPSRCRRSYHLKRALLRGTTFPDRSDGRLRSLLTSLIAVPLYALLLPFLAIAGQHLFMDYLVRLLDHASRIMAFMGVKLVRERET